MAAEIDFDELDRAVSSLIGKPPVTTKPDTTVNETIPAKESSADTSFSVTVNVKPAPATAPDMVTEPESEDESEPEPMLSPGRPVAPAAKRGGRFMDVVHPSSDMRISNDDAISPLTMTLQTPASAPDESAPELTMPDPIDFQAKKDADAQVTLSPEPVAVTPESTTDSEAAKVDALVKEIAATDEPQTSPFLPNAKVTKRPLGSFSIDAPETEANTSIPEMPDSSDDPVPPDTQSVLTGHTITPSDDLVNTVAQEEELRAAERAETDKEAAEAAEKAKPSHAEQKAELQAEAQRHLSSDLRTPLPAELQSDVLAIESNVANMPEVTAAAVTSTAAATGPTSIVQQYKEKISKAKPSGAIYDTESYHKPLQHPAPKKSGWLLTLVILGIIVVGGGVGAAVYFVGLPLLQH